MKEQPLYFFEKVRDRKTSQWGYERSLLSRVEVRIPGPGEGLLSEKVIFGGDETSHFGDPKVTFCNIHIPSLSSRLHQIPDEIPRTLTKPIDRQETRWHWVAAQNKKNSYRTPGHPFWCQRKVPFLETEK